MVVSKSVIVFVVVAVVVAACLFASRMNIAQVAQVFPLAVLLGFRLAFTERKQWEHNSASGDHLSNFPILLLLLFPVVVCLSYKFIYAYLRWKWAGPDNLGPKVQSRRSKKIKEIQTEKKRKKEKQYKTQKARTYFALTNLRGVCAIIYKIIVPNC